MSYHGNRTMISQFSASVLSDTDLERRCRSFVAYSLALSGLTLKQIGETMYNKNDPSKGVSPQRASQLVRLGMRLIGNMKMRSLRETENRNMMRGA